MNKFSQEFKKEAVRLLNEGGNPKKIFEDASIDISDKQKDYALKIINDWRSGRYKNRNKQPKNTSKEFEFLKFKKKNEDKKKLAF